MQYVVIFLFVMVIVAAAILRKTGLLDQLLANSSGKSAAALPYRKSEYLLTKAERALYEVLLQSVDEDLLVFPKIRVLDLLWLPKGTENRQTFMNRVQSKHVDFVLCRKDTVSPEVVIELNDKSHRAKSRQQRDEFLESVFRAAGLAFLPIRAQSAYDTRELTRLIKEARQGAMAHSRGTGRGD